MIFKIGTLYSGTPNERVDTLIYFDTFFPSDTLFRDKKTHIVSVGIWARNSPCQKTFWFQVRHNVCGLTGFKTFFDVLPNYIFLLSLKHNIFFVVFYQGVGVFSVTNEIQTCRVATLTFSLFSKRHSYSGHTLIMGSRVVAFPIRWSAPSNCA